MKSNTSKNFIIAFKPTADKDFNRYAESILYYRSSYVDEAVSIEGDNIQDKLLNILGYYNFEYLVEHDCGDDLLEYNKIIDLYENGYNLFEKLVDFMDGYFYLKMTSFTCENFKFFSFS